MEHRGILGMKQAEVMAFTVERLKKEYPCANVVETRGETILEIDPENGVALAVIFRSKPHFHLETHELYLVVEGKLALITGGGVTVLEPETEGMMPSCRIHPKHVHQAISLQEDKPAVVKVKSDPPWSPKDHFEV
jgi:mannose-6-phosphate isomerase-like protein (cupin superfamily)